MIFHNGPLGDKSDHSTVGEEEFLSHEELVEKVDYPLLKKQIKYAFVKSSFYKNKFGNLKNIQKIIDEPSNFEKLPFTEKDELLNEQIHFPPFGRLAIGNALHKLQRIHKTSGSTGRPLYIALTKNDVLDNIKSGRRGFICAGLLPEDSVIHCLNYCMWAGGVTDHLSLEATGASVIPFGVGNTKQLIETILLLKPTSISCTPSYMSRLEVVLKEEFNLQPPDLGLKKGFFGGEGGLQDQNVRNRIEDVWNIKAIDANYGMAEVLSILGSECQYQTGLHFHGQGLVHLEIIDPNTAQTLPVKKGITGELVLTNLTREAQPLIRYRTKDIITILDTKPCHCGRGSLRFRVEERKDDMIIVRGVNVYPNAIRSLLSEYTDFFSGEFEIILSSPQPIERPLLQVELTKNSIYDEKMLRDFLIKKCHEKLNFTPVVNFIPWGKFPRTEGKSKYIRRNY